MSKVKKASRLPFVLGPLVGILAMLYAHNADLPEPWTPASLSVLGITFWMALWWIGECIPIGATALLPVALLPLNKVLTATEVAGVYMDRFILLMAAGFMAAMAIEKWGLHHRLALHVLLKIGSSPERLILGMLLATAFLSMWISNTATALIMLPVAMALLSRLSKDLDEKTYKPFALALCLSIAYGGSIGGIGTPIGTPPNLIYIGVLEQEFGEAPDFLSWMQMALPIVVLLLAFCYFYFKRLLNLPKLDPHSQKQVLLDEKNKLGPWSYEEKVVGGVFLLMAGLWVTRSLQISDFHLGWSPLLGLEGWVDDSSVAVFGVLLLFMWPTKKEPKRLLDWKTASSIPWDVVLLFGGGLALAKGFSSSGLSLLIGESLRGVQNLHPLLIMLSVGFAITFLTEVTSNTATAMLLMPLLAPVSKSTGIPPEFIMLPAVFAASLAFMLPVATPPNAVVYGSGHISIKDMAKTGFWMNIAGVLIVTAWLYLRNAVF